MSANESKCRQCGRAFKNASALHNHTRKGTKCKTGEEMNLSKPKIQRKHSFLQNEPKWSKTLASPSFEGGVQSMKNDTIGDPNGLKCKVRPGMVFKNNTSLRVHAKDHKSRDGWSEDGMPKGFQKTRSVPEYAEAGLPFSKDIPVVQSFSNLSSSAEGITKINLLHRYHNLKQTCSSPQHKVFRARELRLQKKTRGAPSFAQSPVA